MFSIRGGICAIALVLASCSDTQQQELSYFPVLLVVSADLTLPEGGNLEVDEAFLAMGDFALFGGPLDPDDVYPGGLAGRFMRLLVPYARAHAGHIHGEAEYEGHIESRFLVPLSEEGIAVGELDLPEGHYFDGRFVVGPAGEDARLLPGDGAALPSDYPLSGHAFYLRGTLTENGKAYHLEAAVDVSATVAGLDLATYVLADKENRIELSVRLGEMLGGLDAEALADQEGNVVISNEQDPGYSELKIALKERLNYADAGLQQLKEEIQ